MEDKNGWPKEVHLFPKLEKAAKVIGNIFVMHQLSDRSDHFQHPLDDTFDQPPYTQEVLFTEDLSGWGVEDGEH